jgi:hypothetical protein
LQNSARLPQQSKREWVMLCDLTPRRRKRLPGAFSGIDRRLRLCGKPISPSNSRTVRSAFLATLSACFTLLVSAQPAPSNAARLLGSNTSRPGWRRFAGTWVQPSRTFKWSDLLRLSLHDGKLNVDVLPSADAKAVVRSDRRVMVEIEKSPAIWALSTAGRVWVDTQRKVPSDHFSAWASFDRGMLVDQICPALIRITPAEKVFVGAGRINGQELQVTCTIRGTQEGGVMLVVANVGVQNPNPIVTLHANDLLDLQTKKPAAVRAYLAPLFTAIAGRNLFAPEAGDVYRTFSEIPADPEMIKKVEALLPQMESPSVEDRNAASSALEALGGPGILAAMRIDRTGLSPEQLDRLDRAIENQTLFRGTKDLKTDPYFLLDCLENEDRAVRAAAKAWLEKLTGKPIDYSVDLPEAERAKAIRGIEKVVLPDHA